MFGVAAPTGDGSSRFERYKISVSGVAPVPCEGVENVNLTHIVTQVLRLWVRAFQHHICPARYASTELILRFRVPTLLNHAQHTHYCTMMKEILEEINLAGTASLS